MFVLLITLAAAFCGLLFTNYKRKGTIFDPFFFVMGPYVVLIAINNIFMTGLGFFKISGSAILLHIIAMLLFFVGYYFADYLVASNVRLGTVATNKCSKNTNMDTVKLLLIIAHGILLIDRIYRLAAYGAVNFIAGGEYGPSSIPAHTEILIVPLSIILLENDIIAAGKKNRTSIILVAISALFLFSTFIKYHIISGILIAVVFIGMKHPKLFTKIGMLCIGLVVAFFVGNYAVSFFAQDLAPDVSFYIKHLWGYIAGGTINLDGAVAFFDQNDTQLSIGKWLASMVTSFPNMFYYKLFGNNLINYSFHVLMPNFDLGASDSNVLSVLAAAYCQTNKFVFGIFMLGWGFLCQWVYASALKRNEERGLLIASIFIGFNLLSFFASFFELSHPWEMMIQTFLIYYILSIDIPVPKFWNGKKEFSMKKIQYSVYRRETGSAGGKAKNDVGDILSEIGYEESYIPSNNQKIRVIQQFISLAKLYADKKLVVQYPAISRLLMDSLFRCFHHKDNLIAVVHDLPSLQGMGGNAKQEINDLNHFDTLIVHNSKMEEYLRTNGCACNMVQLGLFDYLHDVNRPVCDKAFSNSICFAGNLDKSSFVAQLEKIKDKNFNLYGIKKTIELSGENVNYCGLLPSDEIVYLLDGDYGLIWDGDTLDGCRGVYGNYLRYNNPHKLSLYVAAGKPVITWKQAAIAEFIENNEIGIVVESLEELHGMDLAQDYPRLKQNVMKLKDKVGTGYYLKTAMNAVPTKGME